MLTRMKLFVIGAALLGGVGIAAAQGPAPQAPARPELIAQKRAERKAEMLAKYDTNKDGKLDAQERAVMRDEMATRKFEKMDADKNGSVSLEEFKKFQAEKAAKRHARGGFHRHHRNGGQNTK